MFISVKKSGYTRDGQQFCQGKFLILMQDKNKPFSKDYRGIVRYTSMHQFGHFMMGYARINNKSIVLSGSYGSDGLPVNVDSEIFEMGIPLPEELYNAWANGEGWNSAGNESKLMRQWAKSL